MYLHCSTSGSANLKLPHLGSLFATRDPSNDR
jgi:hypothetical protein